MKTLFGFPIAIGMKNRIAKKRFRRRHRNKFRSDEDYRGWLDSLSGFGVGSIVQTCAGLNDKVEGLSPRYLGGVLIDVDVLTTNNSCSAFSCGVGPPMTYEEVLESVKSILNHPNAKEYGWDIRFSPPILTIHSDGTYSVNRELEAKLMEERVKSEPKLTEE